MIEQELKEKVISYLTKSNKPFITNSVSYRGVMENAQLRDGTEKDVHIIGFLQPVGKDLPDQICYIYADVETKALEMYITPHIFEIITE
ncbi:MAG: hypothetical protein HWE22_00920 [Flavobacteriales bacterium]|nr:hypothetical protein [Flavobacteriales bacterium]